MGKGQTLKRLPFAFLGIKSFEMTINILIKCLTYKLEMSSNILSILKFAFIFLTTSFVKEVDNVGFPPFYLHCYFPITYQVVTYKTSRNELRKNY